MNKCFSIVVLVGALAFGHTTSQACSAPTAEVVGKAKCPWGDGLCLSIRVTNRLDRPIKFVQGHGEKEIGEPSIHYEIRLGRSHVWEDEVIAITDYNVPPSQMPHVEIPAGGAEELLVYYPRGLTKIRHALEARVVLIDLEGHRYESAPLDDEGELIPD